MNKTFITIRTTTPWFSRILAGVFALMSVLPVPLAVAADTTPVVLDLPEPGLRILRTAAYQPIQLRGLTINAEQPLRFDFIIDPGDHDLDAQEARAESAKLIKYFLAALAVPEDQLWVNLSPYERDRMIPGALGKTAMGRDMLAQDYLLKQLTASMIYPEDDLGIRFWDRVHRRAQAEFGTTDIPMNTFNKVWIVPQEATVHVNGQSVFVVDCDLKVMLEEDYLALEQHTAEQSGEPAQMNGVTAAVVRDVLLPEIEREVNTGETFANLRQIFHAVILATWYKQNLKESLLGQAYAGRNVVEGIDENDPQVNAEIYQQYVTAMNKGVFDYIREDVDPITRQTMPRRYVSGGVDARVQVRTDQSMLSRREFIKGLGGLFVVTAAMVTGQPVFGEDQVEPPRVVAPGVQDRGEDLRWSDRTPMLGESQPGIAYYHSPTNSYSGLLDKSEGGQDEAARIHAAGFRVVKVYTTTQDNMLELERVSKRIYERYGLRTLAIFSPQINGTLVSGKAGALWDALKFYVQHLGQHPWIGIQLGNEDHYYLRGDLLAGDNGIPMTPQQYYGRYDQIASEIRKQLRLIAPFVEANKPILLGQGIRIGHRDDWRKELDDVVGYIRGMKNINGLAVNAYLEPAQLYGPTLQYLRQQTGLAIVVGEFGRSRRHLTPALQQDFNQQAWATIRENIRSGHASGGILFSWSDKVPGDEATGSTPNFRLYDREFGIRYERGAGTATYYDQRVNKPGLIAREDFVVDDTLFWKAVHNPRVNRDYLVWYTQQLQGRAAEQQRQKITLIERLSEQGRLMTDDEVNHYHALNFMGEALYQLAIQALYDGNVAELERLYDQLYVYYSGAQMHYGPRSFWVPFRNLTTQMELIRDTTANAKLKEKLRLIIAARSRNNRPAAYQDIRPDNSMLAQRKARREAPAEQEKIETPNEDVDGALLNSENPGGIDFNPAHMDLRTQGHGIQFRVPATVQDIRIESLRPVIINVTPVTSLPLLLGREETNPVDATKIPHKSYQLSSAVPAKRPSRR